MARDFGGGASDDALAPVIPLFGARNAPDLSRDGDPPQALETSENVRAVDHSDASSRAAAASNVDAAERAGVHQSSGGFQESDIVAEPGVFDDPAPQGVARLRALPSLGAVDVGEADDVPDLDEVRAAATAVLVRKLSAKQLSVSEARDVLRAQGLAGGDATDVLDDFEERGYLNDLALAEMLVTSGAERRGQGRVAIGRTLAQRGIPRHIADEALGVLEDDDAERALEFARSKAPSMARLDDDAALRRLVGQLSRRGYGGSVAMTAARTALRENKRGFASRPTSVRFTPTDDDDLA